MKKRPSPPADPAVVQHELLQKKEELRHMKQKMNELAEENKKSGGTAHRMVHVCAAAFRVRAGLSVLQGCPLGILSSSYSNAVGL
jgi:hypothetical protein